MHPNVTLTLDMMLACQKRGVRTRIIGRSPTTPTQLRLRRKTRLHQNPTIAFVPSLNFAEVPNCPLVWTFEVLVPGRTWKPRISLSSRFGKNSRSYTDSLLQPTDSSGRIYTALSKLMPNLPLPSCTMNLKLSS